MIDATTPHWSCRPKHLHNTPNLADSHCRSAPIS